MADSVSVCSVYEVTILLDILFVPSIRGNPSSTIIGSNRPKQYTQPLRKEYDSQLVREATAIHIGTNRVDTYIYIYMYECRAVAQEAEGTAA